MYHSDEMTARQKMEDMRAEIANNRQQRKADKPSSRVTLWMLLLTALRLR
ncbi:hypothetical protein [Indiicoccus explosivorum]|nr:hypothetical protein [Indiicoccus explosivorum]